MPKDDFNKQGLNCIKFMIESLMENEIDEDLNIPNDIVNDLSSLHYNIARFQNEM